MFIADGWKDYEVIDTGNGEKLERWGDIILRRPDPQAIWPKQNEALWRKADAYYHRSSKGGGEWEFMKKLPEQWTINYKNLKFYVKPTGFKHTGLFPEQAVNWDWMSDLINKAGRPVKVLNLFAYTGGATMACAAAGAHVTHLDASKGIVEWARENRQLCGIDETKVRWIVDDARKFVLREQRRGNTYDAILMDPPSYGRSDNSVWKIEDDLYPLVEESVKILSDNPVFFLINSYTTGLQPAVLSYMLNTVVAKRFGGQVVSSEIGLPVSETGLVLPCGASGRWQR